MRKPRISKRKVKLIVATRSAGNYKTVVLPLDSGGAGLINADMRREVYFGR